MKEVPKSPVAIEILDEKGAVIRKLPPVTAHAGLNRVNWDMHYDPPHLVALRTTPPENPHIWEEPRFRIRTPGPSPTGAWRRRKSDPSPVPANTPCA